MEQLDLPRRQRHGHRRLHVSDRACALVSIAARTRCLLVLVALVACTPDSAEAPRSEPTIDASALALDWIQLAGPPLQPDESVVSVIEVPDGYLALIRRAPNQAPSEGVRPLPSFAWAHRLARSRDALHWDSLAIPASDPTPMYRDVAFGAGSYVLVGQDSVAGAIIARSNDLEQWTSPAFGAPCGGGGPCSLLRVAFIDDRFYAMGLLGALLTSETGVDWADRGQKTAQFNDVAHGNHTFIAVGNTGFFRSLDGEGWTQSPVPCADQSCTKQVFFAMGRFFAGDYSSADGLRWEPADASAGAPQGFHGGWLMRSAEAPDVLRVWQPGREAADVHITHDADAALSCDSGYCFIWNRAIILVPPAAAR